MTRKFVVEAHRHQLQVMPYTVNKLKTGEKLIQMGVDGLITDNPNLFINWDDESLFDRGIRIRISQLIILKSKDEIL